MATPVRTETKAPLIIPPSRVNPPRLIMRRKRKGIVRRTSDEQATDCPGFTPEDVKSPRLVIRLEKSTKLEEKAMSATNTVTPTAPAATRPVKQSKPLPAPNSDFYQLADTLNGEERALLKQVRAFMETKVAPIINKYWIEDSFPFELLPEIKKLNLGGLGMQGYGCRGGSALLFGLA